MSIRALGKKRAKDDVTGIGFDQHYTDSVLKLLAPISYRRHKKRVRTRRSVPKQEILASLLLFGKAYLSWPTWLSKTEFPELKRFEKEDLVAWIPESFYEASFNRLKPLVANMYRRALLSAQIHTVPIDMVSGRLRMRDFEKDQFEREIVESELMHDISVMLEKLFYVSPLVKGNLDHVGYKFDPSETILFPVLQGWPELIPIDAFRDFEPGDAFRYLREDYNGSFLGQLDSLYDDENDRSIQQELATVFDAAISSVATERFAAETSLPIKTSGSAFNSDHQRDVPQILKTMPGNETYQLVKILFHDLRYPVIESIEDVLRLRADPHLKSYRSVIAEYSERLRQEVEGERPQVIKEFRNDIQLALKSLAVVKRWSRIVDLSFYISLPLVVIGTLYGLPLSDILAIPLTTYAKFISFQKRKELDWILFGRA